LSATPELMRGGGALGYFFVPEPPTALLLAARLLAMSRVRRTH
jgi:hypothetical protein